jgi:transposase-like protein
MLVLQNASRPIGQPIKAGPACPNCGRSMHLVRIAPRPEGLSELRVFSCGECGVSLTEAADDSQALSRMSA